jgi:hypothetical protein
VQASSLRRHVRHTKDRWGGEPFLLEEWQWEKLILPVYGTLRPDSKRKYRRLGGSGLQLPEICADA